MAKSSNPFAGVYGGGAVAFNSQPFANHFLQLQAQKQAREQAMDNYYRDQMNSITPAGVRDQDLKDIKNPDGSVTPGWMTKFNNFKDFGIRYKDALAKGDYNAVSAFNRQLNELRGGLDASKEAAQREGEVWKAKLAGKWNPTDNDVELANNNSYSIYDPRHKTLDLNALSLNRTPLDINKWLTGIQSNFKRGTISAGNPVIDNQTGLMTLPTHDVYSPENIKTMADLANINVTNSGKESSDYDYFENMLHSPILPQLQKAYSSVYPNGGNISTPGQAAAAYSIIHNGEPTNFSSKPIPHETPAAKQAWDLKKLGIEHLNRMKEKGTTQTLPDLIQSAYNDATDKTSIGEGQPYTMPLAGKRQRVYKANITPDLREAFVYKYPHTEQVPTGQIDSNGKPILKNNITEVKAYPDEIAFTEDGRYTIPVFYTGRKTKNGDPEIDLKKSKPVLTDFIRAKVGKKEYGVKGNTQMMSKGGIKPKAPSSTHTKVATGSYDNVGQ